MSDNNVGDTVTRVSVLVLQISCSLTRSIGLLRVHLGKANVFTIEWPPPLYALHEPITELSAIHLADCQLVKRVAIRIEVCFQPFRILIVSKNLGDSDLLRDCSCRLHASQERRAFNAHKLCSQFLYPFQKKLAGRVCLLDAVVSQGGIPIEENFLLLLLEGGVVSSFTMPYNESEAACWRLILT